MKHYYRDTTITDSIPLNHFTERYVEDLRNMDITSTYTPDVEPSGEGRNKTSPHILLSISTSNLNYLKSIADDVNEKYFEMGGDNSNGYMDLTVILDDIIERELQDPDIKERFFEMIEEEMHEERERNSSKTFSIQ